MPGGKVHPLGKLGLARAVEPHGKKDCAAPYRHPLQPKLQPGQKLGICEVAEHHEASGAKASK
jgi:hypothetical protein